MAEDPKFTFDSLFENLPELHDLCFRRPGDVAHFVEDRGPNLDLAATFGARPLHLAAISPMPRAAEAVAALLEAGADCSRGDTQNATPPFWAVRWGEVATLVAIEAERIDFAARDAGGGSLAHWWAMGDPDTGNDIESFLKDHGAEFSTMDRLGAAPVHWAAALGGRMERLLALYPDMAILPDRDGFPPIFYVAGAGLSYDAIPALAAAGVDPSTRVGQLRPADVAADVAVWEAARCRTGDTVSSQPG